MWRATCIPTRKAFKFLLLFDDYDPFTPSPHHPPITPITPTLTLNTASLKMDFKEVFFF